MMQKTLKAVLIIIGNEILSGRTQDANTQFIAQKLNEKGIALIEVRVVPDIEEKIIFAVNELRGQVDYVFTTGGIGPTHDDITAESVAKAFGVGVVVNEQALKVMQDYYGPDVEITGPRRKMAMVPDGAELVPNPVSGAPGFRIGNVFVMAGVPRIMQAMLEAALPLLKDGAKIMTVTVALSLRESEVADALTALQKKYADVDIGSYPQYRKGPHNLNIVFRGIGQARLDAAVEEFMGIVRGLGDEPVRMG